MFNITDIPNRVYISKDLTSDQTWDHMTLKFNASVTFSGSSGLGDNTNTTQLIVLHAGGFDDQRITATIKYTSATTEGTENMGVMVRYQAIDSNDDTYYVARLATGFAQIVRVVDTSFTAVASQAFALAQNVWVTITFSVVGSTLTARFEADGGSPSTITLTATDSQIPRAGMMGLVSFSRSMYCRDFVIEQL